jgi:hypothetical protein
VIAYGANRSRSRGPRNTGRDESEQLTHGFGWRLRRRRDAGALIRLARRKHLRPRPNEDPVEGRSSAAVARGRWAGASSRRVRRFG